MPTVSFRLRGGDCLAVMGPSGSGKTLLLRAIADLDASEGLIELDGQNMRTMAAPEWRRQVAYVAAEPGWWEPTVAEHFADWDVARALVQALLLPADIGGALIMELSTGERQRIALIRTLVGSPRYLLLDEPTGALDAQTTEAVEGVLTERLQGGIGILLVTHDREQASRIAPDVLRFSGAGMERVVR
jgi:phosphate-transporting ATPase